MDVLAYDQFDFAIFALVALLMIPCTFLGTTIIHRIVRSINRRDDPRFAKRPPDDP